MPNFSTALTGETGVNSVAALLAERLGWCLRRQSEVDVGIDGQIEVAAGDSATGRLIGAQVKAGPSWFEEQTPDGSAWVFRENTQEHRDYWLNYKLPVVIVLYDTDQRTAYWQHITSATAEVTGKGFKVLVPKNQRIDQDSAEALGAIAARPVENGLQELLGQLPRTCAIRLHHLDHSAPSLARRLARELVDGRSRADQTVQGLMQGATQEWPHSAWVILGEYALEYAAVQCAAECFLRADETAEQAQHGRWTAFAGSLLAAGDPGRARELLARASAQPGGRLLGPIGLAGLEHGTWLGPVPIPAVVQSSPGEVERDPAIQRFLADQAQRAGDLETALAHHEMAFALAPENVGQQLALAEILLRRPTTASAAALTADLRRAANLASSVRDAKRRWLGDSIPAAYLLQAALILVGDVERAFRVATAQPDGEATATEAGSPRLALPVAKIAYEQGRPERAEPFAAVVDVGQDQAATALLAAVRARAVGGEDQEQRWRGALDAAGSETGSQLMILGELADLGCWPLVELDQLLADQQLRPGIYELIHARALSARGEAKAAQALLRRHLKSTGLAAEQYVNLLVADEKIDDALAVCAEAAARFGDARHDLQALDVLDGAGRIEHLLARAAGLLARSGLPYSLRHHVRGKILAIHTQRRDWAAAERLALDGLEEVTGLLDDLRDSRIDLLTLPATARADLDELRRGYAWLVILQQFNQGHTAQAHTTLESLAPQIRDPGDVELWLELHRLHAWTPASIAHAFELAEQHTLPEQLTGRILFTLLQTSAPDGTAIPPPEPSAEASHPQAPADDLDRIAIPDALHHQITDAWHAHLARRAAAEGPGPASGQLSEQALRDQALPFLARQELANTAIWYGRMPLGAASMVTEAPYLLTIAERRARILPIADPDTEVYQGELQAAAVSLGEPVSIETTALFVAAALLDQWESVHPEFSAILLAERAAHDILLSHIAARALGGDVGYFGIDPATGAVTKADLPAQILRRMRRHAAAVHTAAQDCTATHLADLSALGPTAPDDIDGPWPWLAPVALAAERGIALYSDDASLRALARVRGVPAFGTLALLEALGAERGVTFDTGLALSVLFAHHAVDLPDAAGLMRNALAAGDTTTGPVLINLARPAYWCLHVADFAPTVTGIVAPAYQHNPDSLAPLTEAVATGAAATFTDPVTTTALTAATILTTCTTPTREVADIVVPIIRTVAAQHGVDPTARLREMLIGALTDPATPLQLTPRGAAELVDHVLRLREDSPDN